MGISFSQAQVLGFPSNEFVQLLICGHECICLRVGFKKWNIILLCSIVIGTRYVMSHYVDTSALLWRSLASDANKVLWSDTGKDYTVEELKSELQASNTFIQRLLSTIKKLELSERQGI